MQTYKCEQCGEAGETRGEGGPNKCSQGINTICSQDTKTTSVYHSNDNLVFIRFSDKICYQNKNPICFQVKDRHTIYTIKHNHF